ncbi:MAG TPA: tetratricopeptide repeat protein, partial [Thermoanaerobaculia bacterium]
SYEMAGDVAAAEASFRRVLGGDLADVDRALLHRSFGDFWQRRGRTEPAVEQYRAAAELDPSFVGVRLELGHALGRLGRYDEAAATYRQAFRLVPRHAPARLGEAAALILAGDFAEARRRLEEGVATLPDRPTLTHLLARLLAAAPADGVRDGARALELAEAAFSAAPTAATAETVAMANAELGRYDEAVDWQERAMRDGAAGAAAAAERRRAYGGRRPWRARDPEDLLVPRIEARAAPPRAGGDAPPRVSRR